jgi:hypothetical protein
VTLLDAGNPVSPMVMVVFTLSRCTVCPFPPWTHLNFSVMTIQRLYLCSTLVLGGSTHYLEHYWLVTTLLSGPLMVVFTLSRCATWPFPPWTHLNFSVMIIQRCENIRYSRSALRKHSIPKRHSEYILSESIVFAFLR